MRLTHKRFNRLIPTIAFAAKPSEPASTSETAGTPAPEKPASSISPAERYSNQLRRLIQGLPRNFNPEWYRQIPLRPNPLPQGNLPQDNLVAKQTFILMPEIEPKWFLNESTLKALLTEIAQDGSEALLPILALVVETRWHPTLIWLKPQRTGGLMSANFPRVWVSQLKQRLLPEIQNAMAAIRARAGQ